MGQSTFPVPSSGSSTSTILPVNASSVILDGSLTSASTYTTTVNGNGGIAYLVASDNAAIFTIGGNNYTVAANSVSATSTVVGSSASVTVTAGAGSGVPGTFTGFTLGASYNTNKMTYGNGYFIAPVLSSSSFLYSKTGTSYTAGTMPSSSNWYAVAYGNGYYIITCANSNVYAYSTNGTTWTASTMPQSSNWYSVSYGNVNGNTPTFIAASGTTSATNGAYSINNGASWTVMTMPIGATQAITYSNGLFVAVNNSNGAAISSNGYTWISRTLTTSQAWQDVVVGNNVIVCVGGSTTTNYSTNNGFSFTAGTTPSASYYITYSSGVFVYTNGTTTAAYSTNGTSWTAYTATNSIYSIAASPTTFSGLNAASAGSYYILTASLPVNFGIYNGPTTIN